MNSCGAFGAGNFMVNKWKVYFQVDLQVVYSWRYCYYYILLEGVPDSSFISISLSRSLKLGNNNAFSNLYM